MYRTSKESEVSLNTLWNAREKGNNLITRRKDKVPFRPWWGVNHDSCFEARKERRLEERERRIEEELERKQMLSKMTEKELAELKRVEEQERNRRDIAFEKIIW